jgi:DNA-binding MarR family transcriptional regulator/GNAT superfamily N-acetyltransferase
MTKTDLHQRVDAVRRFNRFYTKQIGLLHEKLLRSEFSLTEARVIFELARQEQTTASRLIHELGLDGGYVSRILRQFEKRGLLAKKPSPTDGRLTLLQLREKGKKVFAAIDARSREQIEAVLKGLPTDGQRRLVEAMNTVAGLLGAKPEQRVAYLLRHHRPGDMGWVVHRHGVLYAEEYGWDERFEALVAGIVSNFIERYDPRRERCWMAEREGEIVGSVFLVQKSKTAAKLRLLLVEPKARGLGIGTRLVQECSRFARQAGYRKIVLWTNSILHAARHIYQAEGYRLIHEEPHHSFGHDLIGETWELEL